MSNFRRVFAVIIGVLIILGSIVMALLPKLGYILLVIIVTIWLIVYGVKNLIYYFTMARYMVGGKSILCIGIIVTDLGIFTLSLSTIPRYYFMAYLIVLYIFTGVIDILRAREAKNLDAPSWKRTLALGIVEAVTGLLCLLSIVSVNICVYVFCASLVYNGVHRIVAAVRKTAVVYIQ